MRLPTWELPPAAHEAPAPRRSYHWNLFLFALTAFSVYISGGPDLAFGLVGILLAHEMGHYVACRIHRVDATLPFFIPAPFFSLVGTLGAFIRIRAPIPDRRALFDIGIAGPLAGFVVCLPVLLLGVMQSRVEHFEATEGIFLGEPLLFSWVVRLVWGAIPDDLTLSLGPLGLAAWFGLFVTALNLIPIGQLDGGHVTYALIRQHALRISRIGSWVCVLLVYFGPNWLVWALLVRLLGRRHPPTLNDYRAPGRGRRLVGALGLVVFVICFTPNPIIWSWKDFFEVVGILPAAWR